MPPRENDPAFDCRDLADEAAAAEWQRLAPLGKMPLLVDGGRLVPEASILAGYRARLPARPSLVRAVEEARRYRGMLPPEFARPGLMRRPARRLETRGASPTPAWP